MARFVFSFSWRTLRFAPRLVNRTFGADTCTQRVHVYTRACTRGHRRCAHAWRTLRSHDFDTITCVRRCERAVMFFVTSLCFGRYASGAWISCTLRVHTCTCMCAHSPARTFVCACVHALRHAHLCAHVCTLSGTHICVRMCARSPARTCVSVCMWHVHVSAPCGCVISFS